MPALFLTEYKKISFTLCMFIISLIISGIYNNIYSPTLALIVAVFFSFYVFYLPAKFFAQQYPDLGVKAILQSSRILMIIGIVLQTTGHTERMAAFFYEPSYMSIFMAAYASLCFTELKLVKPIDYIFLIVFLYLSKSAAFILVILGITLFLLTINKNKIIKLIFVIYVLLVIYYISIESTNINYNIIEAALYFDIENLLEFSKQRTGERLNFLMASLGEVVKSPIFGIGSRSFQNMHSGIPPANIFFQIILESGFMGLIVCVFAIEKFFRNVYHLRSYKNFIACTSIALLITLQIESTYMRAYLWVFFGIFNGIIINNIKIDEDSP